MADVGGLRFIDENPATAAFRDAQRFDLTQRTGEASLEGQVLRNEFDRSANPSRLRTLTAGATSAETEAGVGQGTAPHRISQSESAARTAGAGADVAQGTVGSQISTVRSGARTAGATADVAEGTVPSRISTSNSGARSAGANADVAQGTVPSRIQDSQAGSRLRTVTADVAQETAMPIARANVRQHEAAATNTKLLALYKQIELLNAGHIDQAKAVGEQAGMPLPDDVAQNAELRAGISQAAQRAKELYPNRPRDQEVYMQAAIATLRQRVTEGQPANDPTAPYSVPGAPQPQEQASGVHNYEIINRQETDAQGKPVVRSYRHDRRTGEVTPVEGEGAFQKPTGAGGGAGGRQSVYQQKVSDWLAVHPGDQQGAMEFAAGRRQLSGAEMVRSARAQAISEINGNMQLRFRNEAERNAVINQRAEQNLQRMQQANARPAGAPAPAQPQPTPAPAPQPAPQPAPAPVQPQPTAPKSEQRVRPATVPPGSAYSPSRQMWRSPDGQFFDGNGLPVQQ